MRASNRRRIASSDERSISAVVPATVKRTLSGIGGSAAASSRRHTSTIRGWPFTSATSGASQP
jgi:hypothetical protein